MKSTSTDEGIKPERVNRMDGKGRDVNIRRAHNLECHIFQLLNNFFLGIFCQLSGPFYIGFSSNCGILIRDFLPTSGDSIMYFSGSSSQIQYTLRKLLLFSGTDVAYFSFNFPI